MLNIGNLYNCVNEIYGLVRNGSFVGLPDEFKSDFEMFIRYLPARFVSEEKLYCKSLLYRINKIYFGIINIRPQAVSYLKQDDKKFEWKERIIKLLELMGKQFDEKIDFDEYIESWAKKLL